MHNVSWYLRKQHIIIKHASYIYTCQLLCKQVCGVLLELPKFRTEFLKFIVFQMAGKDEDESQDFLQPWKFSDIVLMVEKEKVHVHRTVHVPCSPVFERMFTSEFLEKDKNEIPLPVKKSNEIKKLHPLSQRSQLSK